MTTCTIECTAVPDGFSAAASDNVNLSVLLRPSLSGKTVTGALLVDALTWPTDIPKLIFHVWAGPTRDTAVRIAVRSAADAFEGDLTAGISPRAQTWWKSLWRNSAELDAYLAALEGHNDAPASVEGYDYAHLHDRALSDSHAEFERAYASAAVRSMDVDLDTELTGLALCAARDPNDPLVHTARCLAIMQSDKFPGADSAPATREPQGIGETVVKAVASAISRPFGSVDSALIDALDPEVVEPVSVASKSLITRFFEPPLASQDTSKAEEFERAMKTDAELGAIAPANAPPPERAQKVLGMLQSHPALRKHARQIADLAISAAELRQPFEAKTGELKGVIAVTVARDGSTTDDKPPADILFTAFILRTDINPLFEPCPKEQFVANFLFGSGDPTPMPLRDGFVYPAMASGNRRFQIASVDAIAAYYAQKQAFSLTQSAYAEGAVPGDSQTGPPGYRTRGLMLLDLGAKASMQAAEERGAIIAAEKLLYADDLVEGYRVDVVAPNGEVFPACARLVMHDAFDVLSADERGAYSTDRSDGYVLPLPRTWEAPTADQSHQRFLSVSQVMFTWTGNPIALPGELPEDDKVAHVRSSLGAQYAFDPARPGPILRQYGRYRFMVRVRKSNGSSVKLSKARVAEFALGRASDKLDASSSMSEEEDQKGYEFGFVERAPIPTLLVEQGFKPSHGPDPADVETVDSIVVVGGDQSLKVRWLVSPVTGFDLAEMQGQFDPKGADAASRVDASRRSTFGAYRSLAHEESGGFPTLASPGGPVGLAFVPVAPSTKAPKKPHFVDATLRTVSVRLVATKSTAPELLGATLPDHEVAFFPPTLLPRDVDPDKVMPIRLEIRYVDATAKTQVKNAPDYELHLPGPGGRTLRGPTLCVEIAPGDTTELEIWTNRSSKAFLANPAVTPLMFGSGSDRLGLREKIGNTEELTNPFYQSLRRTERISMLSDVMKLRIEHPVRKPLRKPLPIERLEAYRAKRVEDWAAAISKGPPEDQQDASKIFASGKIKIDRRSTGEVWAEAFWVEPHSRGRIVRTDRVEDPDRIDQVDLWKRETPVLARRLFTLPPQPLPQREKGESNDSYVSRLDEVDLLLDDAEAKPATFADYGRVARSLSAEFECDQHRTLAVRLVARSRFAPPQTSRPDGDDSVEAITVEDKSFLEESASRDDCKAAVVKGAWNTTGVHKIVLFATRRPPPPYTTRDVGTCYEREYLTTAKSAEQTLVHRYRCWLDGDWYASGDGEQLAVVCRKSGAAKLPTWADVQVSRWGGDMTIAPGQKLGVAANLDKEDATYLIAAQIEDALERTAELRKDDNDPDSAAEVELACLTPKFHDGFGRWFCDIALKPTGAYRVALKLILCRYQENAVSGRNLSSVVPVDVFMLPQPWRAQAIRSGSTVTVTVTGPAYAGQAPMFHMMHGVSAGTLYDDAVPDLIGDPKRVDLKRLVSAPLIFVELERMSSDKKGPLPVLHGPKAVVATSLDVEPERIQESVPGLSFTLALKKWTFTLTIPEEDLKKPLAIRVSLASIHANSHVRNLDTDQRRWSKAPDGTDDLFHPSALDGAAVLLPEPITFHIPLPL